MTKNDAPQPNHIHLKVIVSQLTDGDGDGGGVLDDDVDDDVDDDE